MFGNDVEKRESPRGGRTEGTGRSRWRWGDAGPARGKEAGSERRGDRRTGAGGTCQRADRGNTGDRVGVRGRKEKVQDSDLREVVLTD